MIPNSKEIPTFKDGTVVIYEVDNIAAKGNKPVEGLKAPAKETLRYDELQVGITRYNMALQNGNKIVKLLQCPRRESVGAEDVAIPVDGKQYKIVQVQYPPDILPPVMHLSLERLVSAYDIGGV